MALRAVTLDDKYVLDKGRVYLTGTQALVRLPMMQRQRDVAAGLNTGCFISGYRGSPLGGLDQALWSARRFLERNHIRFQPAINEELARHRDLGQPAARSVPRRQIRRRLRHVVRQGTGRRPQRRRAEARQLRRLGAAWRRAAARRRRSRLQILDPGASIRIRVHGRLYPGAEPVGRAGNPRSRPLRLGDVALLRLLDRVQDDRRDGGQLGLGRGRPGADPDRVCPRISRCRRAGSTSAGPTSRSSRNSGCTNTSSTRPSPLPGANRLDRIVIDSPQPRFGIVTTGKSYLDVRQALDDLGIDEAHAAEIGIRLYKVAMSWPLEREGIRHFAEGLEEILVVEEKRAVIENQFKEQLYNWREDVRPRVIGKFDENRNWILPSNGELTPAQIARVIAQRIARFHTSPRIVERLAFLEAKERQLGGNVVPFARTPYFCSGCPHNTSTKVPEGSRALAGIGCHYLAQFMDRSTATFTQMGGEGVAVDRPGAVHRDPARLRQSRRRHLHPFGRAGDPRRGRRQGQHHLQAPVQRRGGDDRRPAARRRPDACRY